MLNLPFGSRIDGSTDRFMNWLLGGQPRGPGRPSTELLTSPASLSHLERRYGIPGPAYGEVGERL